MLNTYVIEGGIGKCTAFTAVVSSLKEKAGESVQIFTPYFDCFGGNPDVKMVYDMGSITISDPRISASDNIYYPEPYKSNFSKGDQHLIESYCELLGVDYSHSMRPKLYTDLYAEGVDEWKKKNKIKNNYVLVQFSGGQTPIGFNTQQQYVSSNADKNYPVYFATYILQVLQKKYPDFTFIDCSLPNEPGYHDVIKCDLHWAAVHELMKGAKAWIGIDSCLNHFSASTGVPGAVVWGNTRWTQFGYMHNQNLSFHMSKPNDYIKTDVNDPRNILVDPDAIIETFEKGVIEQSSVPAVECAHA